jgi:hypothetical protein
MIEMSKSCHRRSICNGSHGQVRVPATVSEMDNTWSNMDTGALALQQITPLNNVAHGKICYMLQNLKKHTSALKQGLKFQL